MLKMDAGVRPLARGGAREPAGEMAECDIAAYKVSVLGDVASLAIDQGERFADGGKFVAELVWCERFEGRSMLVTGGRKRR
jgi:hypothetical protein